MQQVRLHTSALGALQLASSPCLAGAEVAHPRAGSADAMANAGLQHEWPLTRLRTTQ